MKIMKKLLIIVALVFGANIAATETNSQSGSPKTQQSLWNRWFGKVTLPPRPEHMTDAERKTWHSNLTPAQQKLFAQQKEADELTQWNKTRHHLTSVQKNAFN